MRSFANIKLTILRHPPPRQLLRYACTQNYSIYRPGVRACVRSRVGGRHRNDVGHNTHTHTYSTPRHTRACTELQLHRNFIKMPKHIRTRTPATDRIQHSNCVCVCVFGNYASFYVVVYARTRSARLRREFRRQRRLCEIALHHVR